MTDLDRKIRCDNIIGFICLAPVGLAEMAFLFVPSWLDADVQTLTSAN